MDQPEIKFEGSGPGGEAGSEERGELESLRTLVAVGLVLIIVFTAGVDYFLSAQTSEMGRLVFQEEQAEQQATKRFNAFSGRAAEFWTKLVEYSKSHPDFAPIVDKWKGHIRINKNATPQGK